MEVRLPKLTALLPPVRYWKRALLLVWEASARYTLAWALLLVVQGTLPVVLVCLTKYAIDSVVAAKNSNGEWPQVVNALIILVLIAVLTLITEVLQNVSAWVRTAQAEVFGDFLADKIHHKAAEVDLSFYESPEYHDLMEQARGDSSSKPLALLENLGGVIQNAISMVGMGALLVSYGWWLPLVLLSGALPALYVSLSSDRQYHRWWKSTADDRRWTTYYDAMLTHGDAATEMRLFDLSSHFRSLFQGIRLRLRNEKLLRMRRQNYGKIAASVIALVTAAGAVGWMAAQVLYGLATLGDLGVFYQAFSRGQGLMGTLLQSVGKTFSNSLYLENLFAFLDLQPKLVSPINPCPAVPALSGGISFNSVSFCYPGAAVPAISKLDLFIPAGSVAALVGVNGAGKSTLIKLMNRFYDTTDGSIELDGTDLRRFDIKELRRMMSVLPQFPLQYHTSAADNIALGEPDNRGMKSRITASARRAGAHDFIEKLPEQYDTLLGKWFVNGAELSGGEWQRLALARAYFRQAPIIILDEPTSFMDSWSEADWFDRFREVAASKTGIVITHRFTIAMRADVIHVIDDGRVIESGTHRELLDKNGFYAKSWNSQMRVAARSSNGTERARALAGQDAEI